MPDATAAPAAARGAAVPDPLAGLGQTNDKARAARAIVPGAEVWDVNHWPKGRKDKPRLSDLQAEIFWRERGTGGTASRVGDETVTDAYMGNTEV